MNRIKELRDERRMTQIHLGAELEVTQETISAYEMGKHFPGVKSLIKMTEIFHASIDYILGLSDVRLPVKENGLPDIEISALSLFRRLEQAQKERAIAFMQGMVE